MKYSQKIINIEQFYNKKLFKLKRFFKQMDCFQAYHISIKNINCFINLSYS